MLQRTPSPSIASLTRKWWKYSKIRDQKEEYGSKAVMGSKIWKGMEETRMGGPCEAFPIYLLGNLRERRAQSFSLVAWLGDARARVPPALQGQAAKKPPQGKEGQIQWGQRCLYEQPGETWSPAWSQLWVIWQKQILSPAASDWLGKESIPWALMVSACLFCIPLTHTWSFYP